MSAEGDALEKMQRYSEAIWLLAAVGNANFLNRDYSIGLNSLSHAMHCPNAIGNPFLHLRLGQCHFELGALDKAADELMRAYMGAGVEIFKDQDPKSIRFLQSSAKDIDLQETLEVLEAICSTSINSIIGLHEVTYDQNCSVRTPARQRRR